jgi:hypothetical protein
MRELTGLQVALAETMADLSQYCYAAGWMDNTETAVWRLLSNDLGWGQMERDDIETHLAAIRALSDLSRSWIVWDDDAPHDTAPRGLLVKAVPLDVWACAAGRKTSVVADHKSTP